MGIKDIPLKNSPPIPVPPPANSAGEDTAVDLAATLKTPKGVLGDDLQSGSIIKVLLDNGFGQKIKEGVQKGHVYTILHSAPNPDFTLIDAWTETVTDLKGNKISTPRKNYQFFKIITDPVTTNQPVPKKSVDLASREKIPEKTAPDELKTIAIQPLELEQHKEETLVQPSQPQKQRVPKVEDSKKESSAQEGQHHETSSWLQKRLGVTINAPVSVSAPEKVLPTTQNSFELLKKRFESRPGVHPNQAATSLDVHPKKETISANLTPKERMDILIKNSFGDAMNVWELAKKIPARSFIYPGEYSWGTNADGSDIHKNLSDYPEPAKKFREKIVQSVEDAGMRGVLIETTPLEQVLESIFNKGIL